MKEDKKRFSIQLAGHKFTIVGRGSDHKVAAIEHLVNEQFDQISEAQPNLTEAEKALLVAFNAVADQVEKQAELNQSKGNKK